MSNPSRAQRTVRPADGSAAATEASGLRRLLLIGAVLILVVCALEWREGVINPWDRWLQPTLAVLFLAFATALSRWSRRTR